MVMSTQTLASASALLEQAVLIDTLDLYSVGDLVTVGTETQRELTLIKADVTSLVQATNLANAVESATDTTYSVKVPRSQPVQAGQAVIVKTCQADPSLVGTTLYLDKVSTNGLAMITKAVASTTYNVDQQGKGGLS